MKYVSWTNEEVEILDRLRGVKSAREIGKILGRSKASVLAKMQYVATERADNYFDAVRIPRPVLDERDSRLSARPRDLAGALFGDPPVGYSALERRA